MINWLGEVSEAAVFAYLGIGLYSLLADWWSWYFTLAYLIILLVGRTISINFSFYGARLCCRKKTISFKELIFINYGG